MDPINKNGGYAAFVKVMQEMGVGDGREGLGDVEEEHRDHIASPPYILYKLSYVEEGISGGASWVSSEMCWGEEGVLLHIG